MAKTGFIRIPYYPQLNCLFDNFVSAESFVLSILLYWNARDTNSLFIREMHSYQIKEHTLFDFETINKALDKLIDSKILSKETISKADLKLLKKGEKATLTDKDYTSFFTVLKVNFCTLHKLLQDKGLSISKKHLHHSADDEFDFYDVISENALPSTQVLYGKISDTLFEKAAFYVAKIACDIVKKDDAFSYKVFAPGWRILLQPPANESDIVRRYLSLDQSAIDLSLSDGNLFIASGDEYGTLKHIIKHRKNDDDPKVVAAAMLLAVKSLSPSLSYTSDLSLNLLQRAVLLCKESLDIELYLDDKYLLDKDLNADDTLALKHTMQDFIEFR